MLSTEDQNLIEQYNNQTLSNENKLLFVEKIIANNGSNDFAKTIKLQITVEQILQKHPVMEARIIAEKLGKDLPIGDTDDMPDHEEIGYTLSELLQMFAPAPELEESIATRSSSANDGQKTLQSIVVLPENGLNCDDVLFFDLDEPIASPLQCVIYDNQHKGVVEQQIAANEVSFEITFSLPPGRYYWELNPTDRPTRQQLGRAVGMFLVNEDLMPQG
jgi:hypothetical protein